MLRSLLCSEFGCNLCNNDPMISTCCPNAKFPPIVLFCRFVK
ncbi:unnamed protein product [Lathyrus sativus]|nr:unnamed protein product [Lathyrus sativus]